MLDQLIQQHRPDKSHCSTRAFARRSTREYIKLLDLIRDRSRIFSRQSWPWGHHQRLADYLRAVCRMARRYKLYRADPLGWLPESPSVREQFSELIQFTFMKYPAPKFLINAWLSDSELNNLAIGFHWHVGNGGSPREHRLLHKINCSRSVVKFFMCAPQYLEIGEAFRWARTRASGGSEKLARVLSQHLPPPAEIWHDEMFWEELINFFVRVDNDHRQPALNESEILEILEFARAMRFNPPELLLGYRLDDELPLNIEFSVSKRDLHWVRRHMVNWRDKLSHEIRRRLSGRALRIWNPSKVKPFEYFDGAHRWTINELLARRELVAEGHMMRHCVGGEYYIQECSQRTMSIWSLRRFNPLQDKKKRMVTVEVVNESRKIVTALGKCNSEPSDECFKVIKAWAKRENLELALEEE